MSPVSPGNKRLQSPGLAWEMGVEEESGDWAIPQLLGARDGFSFLSNCLHSYLNGP